MTRWRIGWVVAVAVIVVLVLTWHPPRAPGPVRLVPAVVVSPVPFPTPVPIPRGFVCLPLGTPTIPPTYLPICAPAQPTAP